MYPVSVDEFCLSEHELARRIVEIKAQTPLWREANKDSDELRMRDIEQFLGLKRHTIYHRDVARLYQKELSWFFYLWDRGEISKVSAGGRRFKLVRNETLAKMAPAQGTQATPRPSKRLSISIGPDGVSLKVGRVNGNKLWR